MYYAVTAHRYFLRILTTAILALSLAACASTPRPRPTAAELHAELERCKAQHGAFDYAAIDYCFAQARRSLGGAR